MIINPSQAKLTTVMGSRLLEDHFGLVGTSFQEEEGDKRIWTIVNFYAPLRRAVGGIRARVQDTKGYTGFVNQRDLEVLLGLATPGLFCRWLGGEYVGPNSQDWLGVATDDDDMDDLLFYEEVVHRLDTQDGRGLDNVRSASTTLLIHNADCADFRELWMFITNRDPTTGHPNWDFRNIRKRWSRVEKERVSWAFSPE